MKQASMQIAFSQNQLKEKQKELGNNVGDYEKDKKIHNQMIAEVKQLKVNYKKYSVYIYLLSLNILELTFKNKFLRRTHE